MLTIGVIQRMRTNMPVIKSAKKQMRQTNAKTTKNRAVKDAFRSKVKEVKKGIGVLSAKEMQEKVSEAYKAIDKAAKKNIIHKNTAARKKSRMMKLVKTGKSVKSEKKATTKKKTTKK